MEGWLWSLAYTPLGPRPHTGVGPSGGLLERPALPHSGEFRLSWWDTHTTHNHGDNFIHIYNLSSHNTFK